MTIGDRIGRFRILGPIGAGGMGSVYRAHDPQLGRQVAIKVLAERLADDGDARRRFALEARALARVDHCHVVRVLEVGDDEGLPYMVMEHVEGERLDRWWKGVEPDRGLALLVRVARAVAVAHDRGVVHRDLKPGNILVGADGEPKVVDFGLARMETDGTALTRTGAILGTPRYAAPEQLGGAAEVGPWTDVHALGVLVYEAATGRPAFDGSTIEYVLEQVHHLMPTPPSRLGADRRGLDELVRRALAKDPGQRPSAGALATELEAILSGRSSRHRRVPRRLLAGAGLLSSLVLALVAGVAVRSHLGQGRSLDEAGITDRPDREAVRREARAELDRIEAEMEEVLATADDAGRFVAALSALEIRSRWVVEVFEDDPEALELRGTLRFHLGRTEAARADLERAIDQAPDRPGSRRALGHLLLEGAFLAGIWFDDEKEASLADVERIALDAAVQFRRAAEAGADGVALDLEIARTAMAYGAGEEGEVRRLARRALEVVDGPGAAVFHVLLALTDHKSRQTIVHLDRALACRRLLPIALFGRGLYAGTEGRFEEALGFFDRFVILRPGVAAGWHNRSLARRKLGDRVGAESDLAMATDIDPDYLPALVSRSQALSDDGDLVGALSLVERASEVDPSSRRVLFARGHLLHRLGRSGEALPLLEAAIAGPTVEISARLELASIHAERGALDEAIAHYEAVIAREPAHAMAIYGLGNARRKAGDVAGAIAEYTACLEVDPSYHRALGNRALCNLQLGRLDAALADADRLVALVPAEPAAWRYRALIRVRCRNVEGARSDLERALAIAGPDWSDRARAEAELARLRSD